MSLYQSIANEQELQSEKKRILGYLKKSLSLTFKSERKQNEVVAGLLGAADWNTLIASVRSPKPSSYPEDKINVGQFMIDCINFNLGLNAESIIQNMIVEFDEAVFDRHGTSCDVSDSINNMGLEAQLNSLQTTHKAPLNQHTILSFFPDDIWSLFTEASGLTINDVINYITHSRHEYGLCTSCGAENHAGGFCSNTVCCKHEVNDSGEHRLSVLAELAIEHGGGERDVYHVDIADYFYKARNSSAKYWVGSIKKMSDGILDITGTCDRVIRDLSHNKKARSEAYQILQGGVIEDGYSSFLMENDKMLKIMDCSLPKGV
tara:strand:- start:972 stop:1928 length:957 start_codon:yes stop_codon:yes gene_type:complete